MKMMSLLAILLLSLSVMAEHDATYCGKIKKSKSFKKDQTFIIKVKYRFRNKRLERWDQGKAKVVVLPKALSKIALKAATQRNSEGKKKKYCVQSRWRGTAHNSNLASDYAKKIWRPKALILNDI